MNEQILFFAIQNDKIFGMVLCDIKTPKHLKPNFSEFCPIFKNVDVGREDIDDLMEKFAVDNNLLPKPQKMLIGSYFADKILLITPLLKWYINHGLEVTKIYEVVQYLPVKIKHKVLRYFDKFIPMKQDHVKKLTTTNF